jgi:hypothetical protein
MGIVATDMKLLLSLVERGVRLGDVVTLGRQSLHVKQPEREEILRSSKLNPADVERFLQNRTEWADDLLRLLGAKSVKSMDFSAYEGAEMLHDMNRPIDPSLHESFDTVIDGGTLEHVFNFPIGLANCMLMTRTGGRLIFCKPANNQCGHGFYQLSPELFYRTLSEENGFAIEGMMFAEIFRGLKSDGPFYDIADPTQIGRRVELDGGFPVNILVVARKTRHLQPFSTPPQQSDYVSAWQQSDGKPMSEHSRPIAQLVNYLSRSYPRLTQTLRNIRNPLRNARFYTVHRSPGSALRLQPSQPAPK